MCGPKMFYFDKENANVLFGDIRCETHWTRQYKKLEIHPDMLIDARKLEFPDNSFYLVVLDPPHLFNCGKTSDMGKSYGVLEKEWHAGMKKIFDEAWRVLKPNGTLIFKWADKDVTLAELLYVHKRQPLL